MEQKRLRTHTACGFAVCTGVLAGPKRLLKGGAPVPALELTFRREDGLMETRRFLLDRRHPERLLAFLEQFLGHSILHLWELDPQTLLGQQGPLPES